MNTGHAAVAARALAHWRRMRLAVRLAYNTHCSCAIGCYLAMGRQLIERSGCRSRRARSACTACCYRRPPISRCPTPGVSCASVLRGSR